MICFCVGGDYSGSLTTGNLLSRDILIDFPIPGIRYVIGKCNTVPTTEIRTSDCILYKILQVSQKVENITAECTTYLTLFNYTFSSA
jgi:hypothetical protein